MILAVLTCVVANVRGGGLSLSASNGLCVSLPLQGSAVVARALAVHGLLQGITCTEITG
jgi:hypothetical protein